MQVQVILKITQPQKEMLLDISKSLGITMSELARDALFGRIILPDEFRDYDSVGEPIVFHFGVDKSVRDKLAQESRRNWTSMTAEIKKRWYGAAKW